jgi:transcriptional regulator with XRE-family HTH domain
MTENINILIGKRISLERKRLNMRQEDVIEVVNIAQKTQSAIELGKNSPSIIYLYSLAQLGFDVQFIITGVRSENLNAVTANMKNKDQDAKEIVIAMLESAIVLLKEQSP